MKEIKLANGKITLVDDEDFEYLNKMRWYICSKKYAATKINGKDVLLHRIIMNNPNGKVIDHINGNTLDNKKNNLRIASHAENIRHRTHLNKNNLSGAHGVSWFKIRKKWRSRIMINRKEIHLGLFQQKNEAINAYNIAAIKYFGQFSYNRTGGICQ